MKTTFFTLVVSLFSLIAYSQSLSGYVKDQSTGEALPYAGVLNLSTAQGAVCNEFGYFSLPKTASPARIAVSYVGYRTDTLTLRFSKDTSIVVTISSQLELNEVEVTARKSTELRELSPGNYLIPMERINQTPQIFGEADVMKSIRLLPGVSMGNEASSGFHVRGGGADQNLLLLDDVPVYNASHLYGIFSIFNTDALKAANFMKSGISSRYGGRLSSVLDLRLKDGNQFDHHGKISVGLAASKLFLEGPLMKGKATYLVALRRSYADLLLQPVQYLQNMKNYKVYREGMYFHDLIAKLTFNLGLKDKLYFSTYTGEDKFYNIHKHRSGLSNRESTVKWGNITFATRWNHQWGSRTFSNVSLSYTRYATHLANKILEHDTASFYKSQKYQNYTTEFSMGVSDYTAKAEFSSRLAASLAVDYGVLATQRVFNQGESKFHQVLQPDSNETKSFIGGLGKQQITEGAVYLNAHGDIWGFAYQVGLRQAFYRYQTQAFYNYEPRASLSYALSKSLEIRGAYDKMSQNLHLLLGEASNMPTDRWVPATDSFPPSHSQSFSAGMAYHKGKLSVTADVFSKQMDGLITYTTNYGFDPENPYWQDRMAIGKGKSQGVEFMVQYQWSKLGFWGAYTLSKSDRQFSQEVNKGEPFPYKYDRTHDLSLSLDLKLTKRLSVAAQWNYASGMYISLPQQIEVDSPWIGEPLFYLYYGSKNNYRLPAYHRLDLALSLHKQKKKGRANWQFGAYNAYNRQNPYYISASTGRTPVSFSQNQLFPIFPYINYNYEF